MKRQVNRRGDTGASWPPRDRVLHALGRLGRPMVWDPKEARIEGFEEVRVGLDVLASALVEWQALDLRGAKPLDEVLAELQADDGIVERAARLVDLVGRASYPGRIGAAESEEAERLRASLRGDLDAFVHRLGDAHEEEDE